MSIQSNINQTLNLASLLIGSNKSIQAAANKRQEAAKLAAQEKQLKTTIEAAGSDVAAQEHYGEMITDVKKKQFELNPSEKSFRAYKETEKAGQEARSRVEAMQAADKAAIDASAAEAERIKKSRDFARMITEGVPDLSFDPSTYTPPERR